MKSNFLTKSLLTASLLFGTTSAWADAPGGVSTTLKIWL
jgi:hypothetical protein